MAADRDSWEEIILWNYPEEIISKCFLFFSYPCTNVKKAEKIFSINILWRMNNPRITNIEIDKIFRILANSNRFLQLEKSQE